MLAPTVDTAPRPSVLPLEDATGTVALWERLDRVLTYKDPSGTWADRYLRSLASELESHLSMVFHRFLGGEVPQRPRVKMTINGAELVPWDPFARSEPGTKNLGATAYEMRTDDGSGSVEVEAFVLPPKASFSTETEWRRLSGPKNWNRQQGFYVYRANRLIQAGGWLGLRTIDEHTKLARLALAFPTSLDSAFGINVAKMRVHLPRELREMIEEAVVGAAREARSAYDAKPDQPRAGGLPAPRAGHSAGQLRPRRQSASPESRETARAALEAAAASVRKSAALGAIVAELQSMNPEVAHELGW